MLADTNTKIRPADVRPHNAGDTRCAYTLGRQRCPGLGIRRIGGRWYCDLHRVWWDSGRDQALGEELLQDAQDADARLHGRLAAGDAPDVRVGSTDVVGMLTDLRGRLADDAPRRLSPDRRPRVYVEKDLEQLGRLGLALYRELRAGLEESGETSKRAHEFAVIGLFVQACAWGWLP